MFSRLPFSWALSIFLIGLASKFSMILSANSPLPYLDQWDGEAADAYVPYFNHALNALDLIKPHNEHRIFFTRVYDLILLLLNGQWDSTVQMAFNALALRRNGRTRLAVDGTQVGQAVLGPGFWLRLVLAVALPFGWENTLWAFASQLFFSSFFRS